MPIKRLEFLKNIDIFGYMISLSFKKETLHKTLFGGITTTLLAFFMAGLSIFCLFKLFNQDYKENYKYVGKLPGQFGSLDLNGHNFMMAAKFDDETINNWANPFLNITLTQTNQIRYPNGTKKIKNSIKLNPCEEKHFPNLEAEFLKLRLFNALCPDIDANLTIQGSFEEEIFTYLNYEIKYCQDAEICHDKETTEQTLQGIEKLRFNVFIINSNIDEFNIDQPIKREIQSDIHFLIDPGKAVYRTADIYLSEVKIETDYGFLPSLFERKNSITNFTYDREFREQTVFYPFNHSSQNKNIADFYFRKSQTEIKHKRKLGNMLAVLSYLGGIWSSIYVFLFFIMQKYNENSFFNRLSNKIYNFPSQTKKKKQQLFLEMQLKNMQTDDFQTNSSNRKEIFLKKIQEYLYFERKLIIGFLGMLKLLIYPFLPSFCKSDSKMNLIIEAKNMLLEDLDLFNVLRRLHEFDKIKNLLFDKDQLNILNFSPKPNIRHQKELETFRKLPLSKKSFKNVTNSPICKPQRKKKFLADEVNYDNISIFEELINSWLSLKKQLETNKINQVLSKVFCEEFSAMFDISEDYLEKFLIQKEQKDEDYHESDFLSENDEKKNVLIYKKQ